MNRPHVATKTSCLATSLNQPGSLTDSCAKERDVGSSSEALQDIPGWLGVGLWRLPPTLLCSDRRCMEEEQKDGCLAISTQASGLTAKCSEDLDWRQAVEKDHREMLKERYSSLKHLKAS